MTQDYEGITFVYEDGEELEENIATIVKVLLRMKFKWLWWKYEKEGFTVEWDRGKYIMKEYGAKEIDKLENWSGAEWLAKVEPKNVREIRDDKLRSLIKKYYEIDKSIYLYIVPFPPEGYYRRCGVRYDRKNPFHPQKSVTCEDGNKVGIYRYEGKGKRAIIVDFWSLYRYFEFSDPPLSRAMDEFLVDLMRDIASATKPAYAYMNTEEFKPLEFDPMCRNMKEMVKLVRRDGIYTVWSDILWVPKNAILNEFSMEELKIVEGVAGKKWEIVVEEHDDHLFLYPMKPISNYEYVEYRYKNRRKEEKLYRELELPMLRVCGDIEQGVYLDLSYLGEDALKKYRKRILDWSRKYGIRVINLE